MSILFTVPVNDKEAPLLMVRLFTVAAVLIDGVLGTPELITTSLVAVGIPPHQLDALFQLLFTLPSHTPLLITFTTNESELSAPQLPLCTTARNAVGCVMAEVVNEVVILLMALQLLYGEVALSQRTTEPV
jgi:hypothetical protein